MFLLYLCLMFISSLKSGVSDEDLCESVSTHSSFCENSDDMAGHGSHGVSMLLQGNFASSFTDIDNYTNSQKVSALWESMVAKFEAYYQANAGYFNQYLPWSFAPESVEGFSGLRVAGWESIAAIISKRVDADSGLRDLYRFSLENTNLRMLRKLELLNAVVFYVESYMHCEAASGISADNKQERLSQMRNSEYATAFASQKAFENFCTSYSFREPGVAHTLWQEPQGFELVVYENEKLGIDQWLVSLTKKKLLHSIPFLKQGVCFAKDTGRLSEGFEPVFYKSVEQNAEFLKLCIELKKVFPGEAAPWEDVLCGMWNQVSACQGEPAKIAAVLTTFFYWLYERPMLHAPRATSAEWLNSFRVKVTIYNPGYVELIGCIMGKNLTQAQAENCLNGWYSDYIVPVLEAIVCCKGYGYDLQAECQAFTKEWGEDGYNITPEGLQGTIKTIIHLRGPRSCVRSLLSWLPERFAFKAGRRVDCTIWDVPALKWQKYNNRCLMLFPRLSIVYTASENVMECLALGVSEACQALIV